MNKAELKKFLSGLILEYMRINKIDQKEMSERLEVKPSSLSNWLNPERHGITKKHVAKIRFICHDIIVARKIEYAGGGNNISSTNMLALPDTITAVEMFRRTAMDAIIEADDIPSELKPVIYSILKRIPRGLK